MRKMWLGLLMNWGGDTESASGIGMGIIGKFGGTEFSCLSFFAS